MEDHIFYRSKRRDEANMATEYDRILDCTGLYCPEPVFRVRLELDNMESGQILKVTADDPAAEQDIKRLIVRLGHKILEINTDDENIEFILSKG
ncbi:MAG: sulfurtransferase TusA family protein [Dehalococcoidia bacterium]|jgi:TusA-related sulfurtransferase|nr:sulfurtransferase TusA family protein [Dehalococcoidia bacterium]